MVNGVKTTSFNVWNKIDEDMVPMKRDGKIVPDHKASAKANFEEAGSSFKAIGQGWGAVFTGQAIMGGGNPKDRVARAEGLWNKTRTAVGEHGGNALMATFLTFMGIAGGLTDTTHGVIHGASGIFQKPGAPVE